jgi:hypothetical protein
MDKSSSLRGQLTRGELSTNETTLDYATAGSSGKAFKGKDGRQVVIEEQRGQLVFKTGNANPDLVELVKYINESGSKTALDQFNKLNTHATAINFKFSDSGPPGHFGLHQPHGTRPDRSTGALEFQGGKFLGKVDIIKDSNGRDVYREATITIYRREIENTYGRGTDASKEGIVSTFGHEAQHDLDPKQVQETKNGQYRDSVYHPVNRNNTPETGSPEWMSQQIIKEMQDARKQRQQNRANPRRP